jgi:hypothetical protein
LREILKRLDGSPRHFEMTPDAEKIWSDFYIQWRMERRSWQQKPVELTARLFEHVLKIAVVYSVLAGTFEITSDSLCRAIAIGGWLQANTVALFGDTGLDQLGKAEMAIVEILKTKGRMLRRALQQAASKRGINAEVFNRVIKSLDANDVVELGEDRSGANQRRRWVEYVGNS